MTGAAGLKAWAEKTWYMLPDRDDRRTLMRQWCKRHGLDAEAGLEALADVEAKHGREKRLRACRSTTATAAGNGGATR
jgi:hypothetical protein